MTNTITTKDGTQMSADAWDDQMLFLGKRRFHVIDLLEFLK